MHKKFDDNDDTQHVPTNSESSSIWTARFLLISVMDFRFGFTSGSYGAWAIFDIALGRPVSLVWMLCALPMDVVGLCCFMLKCFDWGHKPSTAADDDELEEETSCFLI